MDVSKLSIYTFDFEYNPILFMDLPISDINDEYKYRLHSVNGLDVPNIIRRFYDYNIGGDPCYSLYPDTREIELIIGLNPEYSSDETPGQLRDTLYKMISTWRPSTLQIRINDGSSDVAYVNGYISNIEYNPSVQNPTLTINITCEEALLRGLTDINITPSTSTVLIDDGISTAPHGFEFSITFTSDIPSFQMSRTYGPVDTLTITPGVIDGDEGFLTGDLLYISSEDQNKVARVLRDSTLIHLGDKISSDSLWPIIFPGENSFTVDSPAMGFDASWTSFKYKVAFWGI